jgi:hypothetical protein
VPRKVVGLAAVAITMLIATLLPAVPAWAVLVPGQAPGVKDPVTQLTLTAEGPGQSVNGFLADTGNPFDPTTGYPPATTSPPAGSWAPKDEGFAGVIVATSPPPTSTSLDLYCINIETDTTFGVGYELGTWDSANVSNIGYVARLLNTYYPETNAPLSISDVNEKAAAVQAAIWFFSDRYVLSTANLTLYNEVATIVATVIALKPLPEPSPPTLTITPSSQAGPAGSAVGPFTVTSSTTNEAIVTATGGNMYYDKAATRPIANGTSVPTGTEIWVKSTGPPSVSISATATATVPSGNAYLYDQNTPGRTEAQKLILAKEATLGTTVYANAQFQPAGSLTVTKTITGPAAGHQGPVVIEVQCNGVTLSPIINIPALALGDHTTTYSNIDAGSTCEAIETVDGHTLTVMVTPSGDNEATIPAGGNALIHLTDTYTFVPGSLLLRKVIQGPGAALRGPITINVTCTPSGPNSSWLILVGAILPINILPNIPAGSHCTLTEPVDGSNAAVSQAPGSPVLPADILIPAGKITFAKAVDTYNLNDGNLVISKTIAGAGAGQQGAITLTPSCFDPSTGTTTPLAPFTINANSAAGTYTSPPYTGIPANSVCTVTETANGGTPTVAATPGASSQVTIPPGGTATAMMSDTFDVGALAVTKTIVGVAAGAQGPITITVDCTPPGGTASTVLSYNIPAGATGNRPGPRLVTGLIAGTVCTVTESPDGTSSTVTVAQSGTRTVTISANGTGTLNPIDTYSFVPGSLTVTKVLAGPAAGQQGAITIETSCVANGITTDLPDFTIPAGTLPGSTALTHTYTGVASTSVCTVTETDNGSSGTVNVVTVGNPQNVTVPPGTTGVTATITDTNTLADGQLLLSKTISGPAAGKQGAVTIDVTCGTTTFAPFVISAGTKAGTYTQAVNGVPANSTCTVTETNDGATTSVVVIVTGANQSVTVPPATVVPVQIDDIYSDGPGSLIVTKTLTGPAAGQQGPVSILADCGGPETFSLDIPAGTPAGSVPQEFDSIPAGSTCTVQETVNGGTDTIAVDPAGSPQTVTMPAGGTASVALTDSFSTTGAASTTGELAFTGSVARQLGALGAALILLGSLAVVGARTRTRRWRRNRKDR